MIDPQPECSFYSKGDFCTNTIIISWFCKGKCHFFAKGEKTKQDLLQIVDAKGTNIKICYTPSNCKAFENKQCIPNQKCFYEK